MVLTWQKTYQDCNNAWKLIYQKIIVVLARRSDNILDNEYEKFLSDDQNRTTLPHT